MNQEIIEAIADDVLALSYKLSKAGMTPEAVVPVVARAVPGFVAYEAGQARQAAPAAGYPRHPVQDTNVRKG